MHTHLESMCPSNDGERDALLQYHVLALELVVLVRVAIGELVDLDVVLFYFRIYSLL